MDSNRKPPAPAFHLAKANTHRDRRALHRNGRSARRLLDEEAPSKEEVLKWAQRCPAEPGDTIEIRQIFEAADFATRK